jgi:hypothetical protein
MPDLKRVLRLFERLAGQPVAREGASSRGFPQDQAASGTSGPVLEFRFSKAPFSDIILLR